MYHKYTQEELRSYCRLCIESLEIWARRLVHEKMVETYGPDYIDKVLEDGNYLVKAEIRNHVHKMMAQESDRFRRPVDTLFIEQIIYFLCNQTWYKALFKPALDFAYPQGCSEAREFLSRIVPVRNPLSHSNPISIRQVEQAICYSHDFIDGLKQYYKDRGEEQVWNVPRIIKITDSLGNVFENPTDLNGVYSSFRVAQEMHFGETYSLTVEVDPAFEETEYDIEWLNNNRVVDGNKNSTHYSLTFAEEDVSDFHMIRCKIISKKKWHKHGLYDCEVFINFKVYPPIE